MILSCSSCQSRYLVPASHFAGGTRMVRCARCGHMWLAQMPDQPAAALAQQLSALAPADDVETRVPPVLRQLPAVPRESRSFLHSDWFLAGLLLVTSLVMLWAVLDRQDIAERWPVLEPLYETVGLHIYHVGEGLSLRQVRSEIRFEGGISNLIVEGEIYNDTAEAQKIPDILAAAIGPDGKTMQSWQIDVSEATVAPGATVPFTSSIRAPESNVTEIALHFVEKKNGS
ncbi:MAG: DUF3426 domain-containing protein [Bdellovibrionales bacterium]